MRWRNFHKRHPPKTSPAPHTDDRQTLIQFARIKFFALRFFGPAIALTCQKRTYVKLVRLHEPYKYYSVICILYSVICLSFLSFHSLLTMLQQFHPHSLSHTLMVSNKISLDLLHVLFLITSKSTFLCVSARVFVWARSECRFWFRLHPTLRMDDRAVFFVPLSSAKTFHLSTHISVLMCSSNLLLSFSYTSQFTSATNVSPSIYKHCCSACLEIHSTR